jgi:hypothetical protein
MNQKKDKKNQSSKCPLSKEQQQKVKRAADVVQKHKDVARKVSPFHL